MTTTTPDNTAGRPDRPPREPRSVKEALVNGFRDILARINPAKRQQAQDYIKKQPEKKVAANKALIVFSLNMFLFLKGIGFVLQSLS